MHEYAVRIELVIRITGEVGPTIDNHHALAGASEAFSYDASGESGANDQILHVIEHGSASENAIQNVR